MKLLFSLLSIIISINLSAQLVISSNEIQNGQNTNSVLLEFENSSNKGLLLPTVSRLPSNPNTGTILLDGTNPLEAKIKLKKKNEWMELSTSSGNATATKIADDRIENQEAKFIIGNETSTNDGILVLESKTKAMVLPIVQSTDHIIKPSAGMIVFVKNEDLDKSMLAVYNGTDWSYWTDNTQTYTFN